MEVRMRSIWLAGIVAIVVLAQGVVRSQDDGELNIFFIDVEGGQATLVVSPSGESLLIDSGFPGERDAGRIADAATAAGVTQIDHHMITHLHADHLGSTPVLATKMPILSFVDVGALVEPNSRSEGAYRAYAAVREGGDHTVAKAGDRIPVAGLDVQIVIAGGVALTEPLPGAGEPNPLCRTFEPLPPDESEDARSVGVVIRHGAFSMLDLGDLTWNKEHDLACPNNMLGSIDLYLATRHGLNGAGLPALVQGVRPKVAVINNGATKGASPEHFRTIKHSPGLEDIWQLHYSVPRDGISQLYETSSPGGPELNTSADLIANLDETTAHYLKLTAREDGSFVLENPRTGFTREYAGR
jgi:competence protein ComEC